MIAIIVSENQHLQQTLSKLLMKLGYPNVLTTDSIDEADYFFTREQKKIKLILYENSPNHGVDTPLSRLIIQKEELNLCVVVHVSNHSRNSLFSPRGQDPLSRIDYSLSKPFGIAQLQNAIQLAQRRRSKLRNKIIMLGTKYKNPAIETMYTNKSEMHWKNIAIAENLNDLEKFFKENYFRVGGIITDPTFNSPEVIAFLSNFKKTLHGSLTPLVILSNEAQEIQPFRQFGDLYFNPEKTNWGDILETMSNRVVFHGDTIDTLHKAKHFIKIDEIKKAKKSIDACLALDPERWELLEAAGKIHELQGHHSKSILSYQNSLLSNPCNPSIYLHLSKLLKNSEKDDVIKQGKNYCPFHPQIKALEINE